MRETNTKENNEVNDATEYYAKLGRQTARLGVEYVMDILGNVLKGLTTDAPALPQTKALARQQEKWQDRDRPRKSKAVAGYWANLTPEQRTAEMKRRKEVAEQNAAAKLHPRDPRHPGHAKWKTNIGDATRNAWSKLSAKEKKARIQKALDGRSPRANGAPTVHMEAQA